MVFLRCNVFKGCMNNQDVDVDDNVFGQFEFSCSPNNPVRLTIKFISAFNLV